MAKIILVLALTVAMASTQPIETIATSGGVSLSTQLLNWGQAAFEALLELAKHVLGNSRDETSQVAITTTKTTTATTTPTTTPTTATTTTSGTKILIATGFPLDDGRKTEIVDVEDSSFSCTNIGQFPIKLAGATGGLINGQTPFICGGRASINGDWTSFNDCYQLKEAGSWAKDQRATLTTARGYAGYGSVVLNNNLILTGGYNGRRLSSIEMLSPNTTAQTISVHLPTGLNNQCQVPWDSEKFLVIGGSNGSSRRETYFINVKTNQLTNGPSLNTARYGHACGELQLNGKSYIIVTGGWNGAPLRSTEVLDKNNVGQGWQIGGDFDLPVHKRQFQMVSSPDKKALYAIGGSDVSNSNDIYKFLCTSAIDTCRWTKLETTLRFGRDRFVAIPIPNSLADKLCK